MVLAVLRMVGPLPPLLGAAALAGMVRPNEIAFDEANLK